jgi:hypothetical protein
MKEEFSSKPIYPPNNYFLLYRDCENMLHPRSNLVAAATRSLAALTLENSAIDGGPESESASATGLEGEDTAAIQQHSTFYPYYQDKEIAECLEGS